MKEGLKRKGNKIVREVGNQDYEVSFKDGYVGFIPRSKEDRKKLLKQIINTKLHTRWMIISADLAALERHLITELIDSL